MDTCTTPGTDGDCTVCRGVRPWWLLIYNAAPRDCCRNDSRIATKDERKRYALAGEHTWWICRSCARTHPFAPAARPEMAAPRVASTGGLE